jgi:hypothetical protein
LAIVSWMFSRAVLRSDSWSSISIASSNSAGARTATASFYRVARDHAAAAHAEGKTGMSEDATPPALSGKAGQDPGSPSETVRAAATSTMAAGGGETARAVLWGE